MSPHDSYPAPALSGAPGFEHESELAVISEGVHQGRPVTRVIYGESGFLLLDAEMADANPDEHDVNELHVVCLECLLERHPEAGAGMDVARRSGAARLVDGAWLEEEPD